MDLLTIVYLTYTFISLYFLIFYLMLFLPNRKQMLESPKVTKKYSLSMVICCYNEEESIGKVIESLLNSDYGNIKKIIVADDCSTDGSWKIIQEYAKKYSKVMAVQTPKNTGNAAGAKNYGAKFVDTELIGFTDADSYPAKDSISKMIGHFDELKVGAVTSLVLAENRNKFLEKVQAIEYKMIVFMRRLLSFVEGVYVTPGPLAIYRKSAFDEVGGFDRKNLTEDIEITWHLVQAGYKIKMSSNARVFTIVPDKVKVWFRQRIRWNLGGMQTIYKYKEYFGTRKVGMLGLFILPFFIFNWLLGLFGIGVLAYRVARTIFIRYIATSLSLESQVAVVTFGDINLTPSILVFFGIATIIMNLFLISVALAYSREEGKKDNVLNVVFYMFFYLLAYPILLIVSFFKLLTGRVSWMTK
ncbi:MAG: glycosyltransferase family 2 protein [Nanoarchaeota archaeon]|nr:glycosyltransferase family 2 protein [Nanoarchaeota archaeon]